MFFLFRDSEVAERLARDVIRTYEVVYGAIYQGRHPERKSFFLDFLIQVWLRKRNVLADLF